MNNTVSGSGSRISFDIGGTAAVDADCIRHRSSDAANNNESHNVRVLRKNALGAVSLIAKYRVDSGGTGSFISRWMSATPVRVG